MATVEERMKVLKMIQEEKISAEEGVQLLEALEEGVQRRKPSPSPVIQSGLPGFGRSAKWFRVTVTETSSGKTRVNVRLPVSLVSAGVKLGARFAPDVEGLDFDMLVQHLNSGDVGKIVDVYSDDSDEHVEVYIE